MGDHASLVIRLVNEVRKIVEKGMDHNSTAQNLENRENELRPMFEETENLARELNLPPNETDRMKSVMMDFRDARIMYSKIEWWNCFLAPCYKDELDKAEKELKDYISTVVPVQTLREVLKTRTSAAADTHIQQPILNIDMVTRIALKSKTGLNSELMEKLRSRLTEDEGDKILNLNGLPGTGKTTLAVQLCRDKQVRGCFNDNVWFEPVGSKIESSGEQLASKLKEEWRSRKGLLVLDDVEPRLQELFAPFLMDLPENSKILVISRAEVPGIGRPVAMQLLQLEDAVTLLRYFAQPTGTVSNDLPDDRTVRKVAEGCGGLPLAIKITGLSLKGKPNVFWLQLLKEREGQTIMDNDSKVLDVIYKSYQFNEEFRVISRYFFDLALFPKHEIPVSALLDIWVELYHQDEDGIMALTLVHRLTAMNLAERVLQSGRETGSSDTVHDVDNQFLTQHSILRELASKCSREQAGESDMNRLIIETNRNVHLRPGQYLRVSNCCLAWLKASILQQQEVPRILSITTDQNITPEYLRFIQAVKPHVLVLNLFHTEDNWLPEVIKEMKNLKVLIVTNYDSQSAQLEKFKLLGLLKALKRIRLQHVTIPCVWYLKNLRKLSLYKCGVKKAFEDSSVEFSIAMPNLVELTIQGSNDLVELPAGLCNIVNLKKLSINKCSNFTKLPKEIGKLRNLELLSINYSPKFEEMPESITELTCLSFLDISFCTILIKLPEEIGKLKNLTKLYMPGCSVRVLPDSIINLKKLESVICDTDAYDLWEVIKSRTLSGLNIKKATEDISLRLP